jgi:hypothetical protein
VREVGAVDKGWVDGEFVELVEVGGRFHRLKYTWHTVSSGAPWVREALSKIAKSKMSENSIFSFECEDYKKIANSRRELFAPTSFYRNIIAIPSS